MTIQSTAIKFSPDGKTIATASKDNTVILWSKSNKKLKKLQEDNQALFWSVAWNLKGKTIAAGTTDDTIKIWTKEGEMEIYSNIKSNIRMKFLALVLVLMDRLLLLLVSDKTIKLWTKEGKELKTLKGHKIQF